MMNSAVATCSTSLQVLTACVVQALIPFVLMSHYLAQEHKRTDRMIKNKVSTLTGPHDRVPVSKFLTHV